MVFNVENELTWKQKIHHKSLHREITTKEENLRIDVAPNFDVFGTLFKELFQNVEIEDEQLWSIDE